MDLHGRLEYLDEPGFIDVIRMSTEFDRLIFEMDAHFPGLGAWYVEGVAVQQPDGRFAVSGPRPVQSGVFGPPVDFTFRLEPAEDGASCAVSGAWHDADGATRFAGVLGTRS